MTWNVQKITEDGETTVTGMTSVTGVVVFAKTGWKNAKATLKLAGKNTESGNSLRDQRLDQMIFKSGLFAFELEDITSPSERKLDESLIASIKGKLHIAGQVARIEMPILWFETQGQITITPAENFSLNMRSLEPEANSVNLLNPLITLLNLVPGVEVRDEVKINFNLELLSNCDPKLTPEKLPQDKTEPTLPELGLTIYEERCAPCHLAAEYTNHRDMTAELIRDHYTQNFPKHIGVQWPTREEAYAIQKLFE